MKKSFKDALENGLIVASMLPDGSPLLANGLQCYQATEDGFNMLIGRFHAFGDTLRKHDELKLTGDQFATGLATIETMLKRCRAQATTDSEQVLDAASEGLLMVDRLRQRQSLGLSVEQVYEIASIFHFTELEDPGAVDWAQSRKNQDSWLKDDRAGEFYAFFLGSPIGNYIPLASLSDKSMLSFLKELNINEILDWTRILLQLRMNGTSSVLTTTIESRRETLFGLDGLLSSVLSPTSTIALPGSEPNSENR
ncbi:hypothetical protein GCM10028808_73090 [Spirosoma migulaei]